MSNVFLTLFCIKIASTDRDLPDAEKRLAARVLFDTRLLYADVLGLIGRLCLAQVCMNLILK